MKLENDTILITGGSSGIGLELAKKLSLLGNTVIITGRNKEKLEAVKKKYPQINYYQNDICNEDSVKELANNIAVDYPNLNIVINNAGIMSEIQLDSMTNNICSEIDTNLKGMIYINNYLLSQLQKQKEAAIVNISSGLAFVPFDKTPIYSVSKAGVHMYTKALRNQLKKVNVEVIELVPPKTNMAMINEGEKANSIMAMDVSKLVDKTIVGIKKNKKEIKPELSKVLKLIGRLNY